MNLRQCLLTKNDCYKAGRSIHPAGIVVHSTGANNPTLRRYVQPDDGILGENAYGNDWNRSGVGACVHAFIGKTKDGTIATYQTLPWTMRCWGCASGKNGSYNNSHIQFEICEDALTDAAYFKAAFREAAELCAYLCRHYGISTDKIVSHWGAHQQGYASGHGDCDHWLKRFDRNMDDFRRDVQEILDTAEKKPDAGTAETPGEPQEEVKEVRYEKLKDVKYAPFRKTLDKLIEKGFLAGKGGDGEERVIDLSEDSVRLLVILDAAGVFG